MFPEELDDVVCLRESSDQYDSDMYNGPEDDGLVHCICLGMVDCISLLSHV